MLTCGSPQLIAAYRVLHRQSVPWHPPCALVRLILPVHSHSTLPKTIERVEQPKIVVVCFFPVQFSRCVLGCPGSFKPSQLRGSVSFGTDNRQSRFQRSLACRAHPSVEVSTYRRSFKTIQKSIILLVRSNASLSLTIFSTPCVVVAGLSGFLHSLLRMST